MSARSYRLLSTTRNTFYPRYLGTNGAVASEHYLAASAGADVMKAGGNAIDACVAMTLCEGLLNPHMHTIGGECPILLASAGSRTVVSIDGNMVAPGRATPEAFHALGHQAIPAEGVLAAGVPGAFGALVLALQRYGRLSFAEVAAPAIALARRGFPLHAGLLRQHKYGLADTWRGFLDRWPATAALYLPEGRLPAPGRLMANPALADTYDYLAGEEAAASGGREARLQAVFDGFYKGEVARAIVAFSEDRGGLLQRSDFERYRARIERPCSVEIAGTRLYKCDAWNQGPALLQTLSILKGVDLGGLGHNSSAYVHLVVEAMKLAYADREQYYGDPDFADVPLEALLSDRYGAARRALIDRGRADPEIRPGDPLGGAALLPPERRFGGAAWGDGTVHVDAIDGEGNMAAFTPSGAWIKSCEVIAALGFPLSVRLSNCPLGPAAHPNVVAPFKRPRTTISPSLACRDGAPWSVFGSMGGDQQDQWQLQYFLNRVVFDMPVQEAIEAPKFSSEHFPATFAPQDRFTNRLRIEASVGEAVLDDLRVLGHEVDVAPDWSEGFLLAIERDPESGVLEAGCDPRGTKSDVFPAAALVW